MVVSLVPFLIFPLNPITGCSRALLQKQKHMPHFWTGRLVGLDLEENYQFNFVTNPDFASGSTGAAVLVRNKSSVDFLSTSGE
jgi:hypothetical protein